MRADRAGAAPLIWLFGALFLSACATGDEIQLVAALSPPPQSQPAPEAARSTEPPGPDVIRAEMISWLSRAGYQPAQIGAIIDYAQMESGFRPCAINPAGYRYTFQWSGPRLRRLEEFAGTRACPHIRKQLAFADHELRNEPNYACFWRATTRPAALTALRRGFGYGKC